ncbi:MAG: hypothetical protein ACRDK1_00750 [Solirubrobacterales bacterium]
MPFHVEIRQARRRAWAFNLSGERLSRIVVEPWRQGLPVALGDREWAPKDSALRILEGPELSPPDLAHGSGWHNAERSGEDATRTILSRAAAQATSIAVLAETPTGHAAVAPLVERLGVQTVEWAAVRARLLAAATAAGANPLGGEVLWAILVVERPAPSPAWLFEAGLALGALGGRAVLTQLGDEPAPAPLRDLAVIRIDPNSPSPLEALGERLQRPTAEAP